MDQQYQYGLTVNEYGTWKTYWHEHKEDAVRAVKDMRFGYNWPEEIQLVRRTVGQTEIVR